MKMKIMCCENEFTNFDKKMSVQHLIGKLNDSSTRTDYTDKNKLSKWNRWFNFLISFAKTDYIYIILSEINLFIIGRSVWWNKDKWWNLRLFKRYSNNSTNRPIHKRCEFIYCFRFRYKNNTKKKLFYLELNEWPIKICNLLIYYSIMHNNRMYFELKNSQ